MCGIYASISTDGFKNPSTLAKEFLCNRGPDHIGESHTQLSLQDGKSYWISLISTVLALRGGYVTAQPFKDYHSDSLLCWNGEAWKIGTEKVTGNDGQAIFDALVRASLAQVTSEALRALLLLFLLTASTSRSTLVEIVLVDGRYYTSTIKAPHLWSSQALLILPAVFGTKWKPTRFISFHVMEVVRLRLIRVSCQICCRGQLHLRTCTLGMPYLAMHP